MGLVRRADRRSGRRRKTLESSEPASGSIWHNAHKTGFSRAQDYDARNCFAPSLPSRAPTSRISAISSRGRSGSSRCRSAASVLAPSTSLYFVPAVLSSPRYSRPVVQLPSPFGAGTEEAHIPEALGAAVVVLSLLGLLGESESYELAGPAYSGSSGRPSTCARSSPGAGPERGPCRR